jgi:DNA-binding phage protein
MPEKFARFDVADYLQTPLDMSAYLKACKEEDSGDGSLIRLALKDVTHTISTRIQRDPVFAQALRIEVATLFRNGEPEVARRLLYLLTNALRHQTACGLFTYRP